MLEIEIPGRELFDEKKEEFIYTKDQTLKLEHSLISLSKWESKWEKAFLNYKESRTYEQSIDYIRCMTINSNVDPMVYYNIDRSTMKKINEYMKAPMTATWFSESQTEGTLKRNGEVITSELIYYWMISYNIPFECEKWHLNRLLTLIRVCHIKNASPKKMSKNEILKRNASLNAQRRARTKSKG